MISGGAEKHLCPAAGGDGYEKQEKEKRSS